MKRRDIANLETQKLIRQINESNQLGSYSGLKISKSVLTNYIKRTKASARTGRALLIDDDALAKHIVKYNYDRLRDKLNLDWGFYKFDNTPGNSALYWKVRNTITRARELGMNEKEVVEALGGVFRRKSLWKEESDIYRASIEDVYNKVNIKDREKLKQDLIDNNLNGKVEFDQGYWDKDKQMFIVPVSSYDYTGILEINIKSSFSGDYEVEGSALTWNLKSIQKRR